ncbi:hypothetical protein KAU39_05620 [bacterium]|nr:hypothetical protein [bacterium]
MLGYWVIVILLGFLMSYNLINAYQDYVNDKKTMKFLSRLVLLMVLFAIVLNSLFSVMEFGLEIPTIF